MNPFIVRYQLHAKLKEFELDNDYYELVTIERRVGEFRDSFRILDGKLDPAIDERIVAAARRIKAASATQSLHSFETRTDSLSPQDIDREISKIRKQYVATGIAYGSWLEGCLNDATRAANQFSARKQLKELKSQLECNEAQLFFSLKRTKNNILENAKASGLDNDFIDEVNETVTQLHLGSATIILVKLESEVEPRDAHSIAMDVGDIYNHILAAHGAVNEITTQRIKEASLNANYVSGHAKLKRLVNATSAQEHKVIAEDIETARQQILGGDEKRDDLMSAYINTVAEYAYRSSAERTLRLLREISTPTSEEFINNLGRSTSALYAAADDENNPARIQLVNDVVTKAHLTSAMLNLVDKETQSREK